MTGADVRKFFRDLLGSRLTEQLTMDLLNARADSERLRQDLQGVIAELRQEKALLYARLAAYESKAGLVDPSKRPPAPTFGVDFSKMPPMKTKWQAVVEQHEAQLAKEDEQERLAKEAKA